MAAAKVKTSATVKQTADTDLMFRAFSDRTRLRILHILLKGELCVGHLVDILQIPQPKTSRHLAYLRKAGLVQDRREGLWKYYSLTEPSTSFHGNLLKCLEHCFAEVPELQADDKRRVKVLKSDKPCCSDSAKADEQHPLEES